MTNVVELVKLEIQRFVVPAVFIPGFIRFRRLIILVPFLALEIRDYCKFRQEKKGERPRPSRIYGIACLKVCHTSGLHTMASVVLGMRTGIGWSYLFGKSTW